MLRRGAAEPSPVVVPRAGIAPRHALIALVDHLVVPPVGVRFDVDRILAVENEALDALEGVMRFHLLEGRHEEAAEAARRSMSQSLDASMLHTYAGWQIAAAGYHEDACEALGRVAEAMRGTPMGEFSALSMRALPGKRAEASARVPLAVQVPL